MNDYIYFIINIPIVLYYCLKSAILFFVPLRFKAKDITDELALITGAGSGIGRLMAIEFAKRGAHMVLWDIDSQGNQDTASMVKEHGRKAYTYTVDVTNSDQVYHAAAQVKEDAGVVSILVNNAGIVLGTKIMKLEDKMIKKIFDVNSVAHFWTIKAFLPDMMERNHGHFVTISSLAGLSGLPRLTDYCATKFAALGILESLNVELQVDGYNGINVTSVCPFFINTGMFNGAYVGQIFSYLEPEYVAEEVVNAVQCNNELVILPKKFTFLILVKSLIPSRAMLAFFKALGGYEGMVRFTGRIEKPKHL